MTDRITYSDKESAERAHCIKLLFERGIESNGDNAAIHGAGYRTFDYLSEFGVIPGSFDQSIDNPVLIVYPIKDRAPLLWFDWRNEDKALFGAKAYAHWSAQAEELVRLFGWPVTDETLYERAYILARTDTKLEKFYRQTEKKLVERGIFPEDKLPWVKSAIEKAQECRGMLFSFKPELFKDFQYLYGPRNERSLRIICPNGVPLKYIAGLQKVNDPRHWRR